MENIEITKTVFHWCGDLVCTYGHVMINEKNRTRVVNLAKKLKFKFDTIQKMYPH